MCRSVGAGCGCARHLQLEDSMARDPSLNAPTNMVTIGIQWGCLKVRMPAQEQAAHRHTGTTALPHWGLGIAPGLPLLDLQERTSFKLGTVLHAHRQRPNGTTANRTTKQGTGAPLPCPKLSSAHERIIQAALVDTVHRPRQIDTHLLQTLPRRSCHAPVPGTTTCQHTQEACMHAYCYEQP